MTSGQQNESRAESVASTPGKSKRLLACMECQRRKIKCDHEMPCSNCMRLKLQCVPATQQARRRRRKYPEKLLLDRLRHYESLLQQSKIAFQPLRAPESDTQSMYDEDGDEDLTKDEKARRQEATIISNELLPAQSNGDHDAVHVQASLPVVVIRTDALLVTCGAP